MFQVNNKNTRTTSSRPRYSDVFIVSFEQISNIFLVFLLFTLNK